MIIIGEVFDLIFVHSGHLRRPNSSLAGDFEIYGVCGGRHLLYYLMCSGMVLGDVFYKMRLNLTLPHLSINILSRKCSFLAPKYSVSAKNLPHQQKYPFKSHY